MKIEAEDQMDWDEKLPIALTAIRTTTSTTIKETPFSVISSFNFRNKAGMIGTGKVHQLKGKAAKRKSGERLLRKTVFFQPATYRSKKPDHQETLTRVTITRTKRSFQSI